MSSALWLVGFRPFFGLACLSGLILPVLWVLLYAGWLAAPPLPFSSAQWHAHEMFFGFGWAVIGGFLLTSTKNWVQVRGYHGRSLQFLAAAWILERVGMWCAGQWPAWLFYLSNNLFLGAIVAMLVWTLVRHRATDSYKDNYFFLIALPLFIVAKALMLSADNFQLGWTMTLGLFRIAFLVMLERTLTQFMKGVFQVDIPRHAGLDRTIKLLAVVLIFAAALPAPLAAGLDLSAAGLLAARLLFWHPRRALSRIDIGVMYLGYLGIVLQLLVDAYERVAQPAWVGAFSAHLFTFGVMGLIIPGMLIRISKGHTGRKVSFDAIDKSCLYLMMAAFFSRVLAPQLYAAAYVAWIGLAAACWFVCFAILSFRYIPFLVAPRVDGKEH